MSSTTAIDTSAAIDWYRRNRARSEAIFDLIDPSAYYSRPISLRNPIVFYEGHLPAFSVIAFLRRGLGLPPVDARLEQLFERGIDPDTEASAVPRSGAATVWPSRDEVRAFARACDDAVVGAMASLPSGPVALEGLYTALEHEAMHQETLLYMWHRLPYEQKRAPLSLPITDSRYPISDAPSSDVMAATSATVRVPAGDAVLGADRGDAAFGWDNEFDRHVVHVPAFDIDVLPVTNKRFLEFMNDGGYRRRELWSDEGWEWLQADRVSHPAFWLPASTSDIGHRTSDIGSWQWRGMFEAFPLPPDWPVYTSQAEAGAYARWKDRRLITEPEWHRAAEGSTSGHFDFAGFDPIPVGSHPPSRAGVYDLVGNG